MREEQPDKRYLDLAEKWLNGTITPEEEKEYAAWYNSIDPDKFLEIPSSVANDKDQYRVLLLAKINAKKSGGKTVLLQKHVFRRLAVAASLTGLIIIGYFLIRNSNHSETRAPVALHQTDIKPASHGTILKLAGGKTILLDTAKNGNLVQGNTGTIIKDSSNLVFRALNTTALQFNELSTARGSQQQIRLADGTNIFLNASSSIRFPAAFTGSERIVEITGEAYFEVAKNPEKPFIVKVNNSEIKVLGTHFNVMAYPDENSLQTTLLEGAVEFKNGNKKMQLKPGQQSQLNHKGEIKLVSDANTDQVIAWKNGLISFDNADIKTIMRELQRWYDIDVEYKGDIPAGTFSGEIQRTANLSEVLKVFEVSKINFSIDAESKKLTVMP